MFKKFSWSLFFLLVFVSTTFAGTNVYFKWDANTESDLAGYRLYISSSDNGPWVNAMVGPNETADLPCAAGDINCAKAVDLNVPDGTWFWICRAYDQNGNESGNSNIVTDTLDTPPNPPSGLSIWQKIVAFYNWLKHHHWLAWR